MPYHDPDPTDPMMLQGVVIDTEDDHALLEMTECFIEEYLRLGFEPDRILRIFKTRGYAGPFLAYQTLGAQAIQTMIADVAARRAPRAASRGNCPGECVQIALPILESWA